MTSTSNHPNLITYNLHPPDLNSARATKTPTFTFPTPPQNEIILLDCVNPFSTCLHVKSWLLGQHDERQNPGYAAPGILRMEYQALEKIDRAKEGWMLVAPGVARVGAEAWMGGEGGDDNGDGVDEVQILDGPGGAASTSKSKRKAKHTELEISVIGIVIKSDPRVRRFYTPFPLSSLLSSLSDHDLVRSRDVYHPTERKDRHWQWFVYLRQTFTNAVKIPESPDFVNAEAIGDCCPSILDPEGAVARLEEEKWLYWNTPGPGELLVESASSDPAAGGEGDRQGVTSKGQGKEKEKADNVARLDGLEPSDDRYLHHLHPAERELASLARLKCAEYLFIKRSFFRAFWEEVYRSDKIVVGDGTAVTAGGSVATTAGTGADAGRQDTPFSTATSTAAPPSSRRDDTPARGVARRVQPAGFDRAKRNRVRTERAHQVWLEQELKCRTTQAKTLVVGWRVLGFLDEERFAVWVREGWGASDGEKDEEEEGEEEGGEEERV